MMTSTEAGFPTKRVNDTSKKSSPLKVVSPIIKKYSGQRQGRIKKKLDLPRRLSVNKSKKIQQSKPPLKTILPKTNSGDVIILEPDLIPCALNIHSKRKRDETGGNKDGIQKSIFPIEDKVPSCSSLNETTVKSNKPKLGSTAKRKRYLKNIEDSCTLLKPEAEALKEKRDHAFAVNYLQTVQQKLKGKDDALYMQFVNLICDFQKQGMSVIELYKRVRQMFANHIELGQDFIAFLTPVQAIECGIYLEHLMITTMTDFLNMIDVYFSKSPHQVKKIHSVLGNLATKPGVTTEDVKNAVLPLLKGNTVLQDYFQQMLPHGTPPNNFLMDFEEIEYSELNSDLSEDEERYEIVKVPDVEDCFGGDTCPCDCHNSQDEKFNTRNLHCTSCSVKFINGKIFIQQGKLLRPAKVTFDDHDMAYHRDRLAPKLYPKRGIKKSRGSILKENSSPTKSCCLSSDEFKSDIEDDEKLKTKLGLMKTPRTNLKKLSSPKNCDKTVVRSIFCDQKCDIVDSDDKAIVNKGNSDENLKHDKLLKDTGKEVNVQQVQNDNNLGNTGSGTSVNSEQFKSEQLLIPTKSLDLPQIDGDESIFCTPIKVSFNPYQESVPSQTKSRARSPVFVGIEGSKSPPVISIPDSANPSLFPSGKPILSFLENFDESREPVLLPCEGETVINFDSCPEVLQSSAADNLKGVSNEKEEIKVEMEEKETKEKIKSPWKIDEDRIILHTLQVEENCDETFRKINAKIPSRSLDDIKKRFATLMNMLYEMKTKTKKDDMKDEVN